MRYRLRTLLILLALLPPLLWGGYVTWGNYVEWQDRLIFKEQERQRQIREFVPTPLDYPPEGFVPPKLPKRRDSVTIHASTEVLLQQCLACSTGGRGR